MRNPEILPCWSWVLGPSSMFSTIPQGSSTGYNSFKLFKTIPPVQFFAILHRWWWLRRSHSLFVGHFVAGFFIVLHCSSIVQGSHPECASNPRRYSYLLLVIYQPTLLPTWVPFVDDTSNLTICPRHLVMGPGNTQPGIPGS